jgi:hypothetical protein
MDRLGSVKTVGVLEYWSDGVQNNSGPQCWLGSMLAESAHYSITP